MLTTYDRILRMKRLQAKLEREAPRDQECVAGALVALTIKRAQERRQAVKDSCRGMEGQ